MSIPHETFKRLLIVIPDIETIEEHGKSKSSGFMDFSLDILSTNGHQKRIAISHYYKHSSGDMIPDPDMELSIDFRLKIVQPLTYQDMYRYDEVFNEDRTKYNPELLGSLQEFLLMWLNNLNEQGHKINKEG